MANHVVSSGQTSNSITLSSGDTMSVLAGGTAVGTVVSSGGSAFVSSGGVESSTVDRGGSDVVSTGGVARLTTVSSGGNEVVSSGGVASGTIIRSGGFERVSAGGLTTGTTVSSGGTEIVYSGGQSISATVSAVGTLSIQSGGSTTGTIIQGGLAEISAGGVARDTAVSSGTQGVEGGLSISTTVGSGGAEFVLSGVASGTTISSGIQAVEGGLSISTTVSGGGTEYVLSGVASATTVSSNGLAYVYLSGIASDTVVGSDGADVVYDGGRAIGTDLNGGIEYLLSGGLASDTTLGSGGFEIIAAGGSASDTLLLTGGTIDVTYLTYASGGSAHYDSATHLLTVSVGGQTYSQTLSGDYSGEQFLLAPDDGTGTDISLAPICFCAGTRIATPQGELPVERLAVGDRVLTASGEARPIVWIGEGRVLATRGRRSAATPVIVRKGAIADNVPNRDLHVTKGHALYLDEVLIPVEYLVNHRSILWDDRAQEVHVYHLELETHDVLMANGAPAESYRDDGNRWLFGNANTGWNQQAKPPCAPVLTGGAVVDAAWRRLLQRAGPRAQLPLTDDPDLHLLIDGKRTDAIERHGEQYVFRLPARPRSVRIRSRAGVPQELGIARDTRPLGVAVHRLVLVRARWQRTIEADAASLVDGYHAFEPDNHTRWTNGNAAVPAELFDRVDGPCLLVLHLGGATQYLDEGTSLAAASA